jgi:hypothetical protein
MGAEFSFSDNDTAHLIQELLAEPAEAYTLPRVVQLAREAVSGCDFAGISIRRGRGKIETPAWTDEVVISLDGAQYDLNEGPCLDAVRGQDMIVMDDTATDPRWPRWGKHAAGLGVQSVLSVQLAGTQGVVGGLNLYSTRRAGFSDDALQIAQRYASLAGTAVSVVEEIEGLRTAMASRHLIGVAQGMVMMRYGLDEDQAFRFLVRTSQSANIKLRDIAERVIAELAQQRGKP